MSRGNVVRKTYDEALVGLINEYRGLHDDEPFTMDEVADWAIQTGRWEPQKRNARKELRRHLSAAARKIKVEDPQGRTVRVMHAARTPKKVDENGNFIFDVMWDLINTMSRHHAEVSFEQRREKLAHGARCLKADMDSFNDNNPNAGKDKIQKSFDFTFDVEPMRAQVVDQVRPTLSPGKPR